MSKRKDVSQNIEEEIIREEEVIEPTEEPMQEIECEVLWVKPYSLAIRFNGEGISFRISESEYKTLRNKTHIKAKFNGSYGTENFKIELVFD